MFRTFRIPITWTELIKRTVKEVSADNVLGLAAQLAYYLLLALVPAVVFLVAITSFFPPRLIQDALASMAGVLPADVFRIFQDQLRSLSGGRDGGLLTFGFVMALWSSSAAMVAITDALNRAYDIEERRPWWKVRLTAIALTIALAIFVLVAVFLVMVGPTLAEWLASRMGLGSAFAVAWKILQWPAILALMAFAIGLINYFAPDAEQDWEWITPGAIAATLLWLLASLAFKLYLANFADYNETYGSLGGVIVLMLWFYLSGLAILVGAELNAEIEHASPHGKQPGEKVPGQKKKIGAAAAREYQKRRRQLAGEGPEITAPPAAARKPAASWSEYPAAAAYLIVRLFRRVRG
jgi:membrane protein